MLFTIHLNQTHMSCSLRDMQADPLSSVESSIDRLQPSHDQPAPGTLPTLWKYENIHSDQPHPGFTLIESQKYLKLEQIGDNQAGQDFERTVHGEVAPHVTGSKCWPAAYVLLRFLENYANGSSARNVLELGAGTGAVGLVAALLGHRVTLTDLTSNLRLIERNKKLNGLDDTSVKVQPLDWLAEVPGDIQDHPWDLVLVSDCVFWPDLFDPLIQVLRQVSKFHTTILFSVTHRFDRTKWFLSRLSVYFDVTKLQTIVRFHETDVYQAKRKDKITPNQKTDL